MTPVKRKRGRPAYVPSDKERRDVTALAAYGVVQEEIARVLGVNAETLRIHFRRELDCAAIEANAKVTQSLYRLATSGNVVACIFWLKVRGRWMETTRLEVDVTDHLATRLEAARARYSG